jgi:RimJ/RimL family protein N-acetyltransferase
MDGSLKDLEKFYIELLSTDEYHAFIGEVNGEPTFTFEPYWSMRDRVGAYYEAKPDDVGIHLLIGPTSKYQKHTFHLCRALMTFSFNHENVGKIVGEADVNMRPMHMLVSRIGFKFQRVLELPYKTANLTFCTRETYLERFPNEQV